MKKFLLIIFCIPFLIKCDRNNLTNRETIEEYYNARNSVDFKEISELLNHSFTIIEGDHVMPYTHESYYEVFKWDSIFQTKYEIVELKELEGQVLASISLNSIRNEFLQNTPMTCQFKFSLKFGKISKVESLECKDADWGVWQKRVTTLVDWIEINHPELNGFIHDMTMNGAKKYIKAIELYNSNQIKQ